MPTKRTLDILRAIQAVACPEPGCAAPIGAPCRRLDGGRAKPPQEQQRAQGANCRVERGRVSVMDPSWNHRTASRATRQKSSPWSRVDALHQTDQSDADKAGR